MNYKIAGYTNSDYIILLLDSYYNHRAVMQSHLLRQRKIAQDNYINPNEFYQKIDEACYALETELKSSYYRQKATILNLKLEEASLNINNLSNNMFLGSIFYEDIMNIKREIELSLAGYKYELIISELELKNQNNLKSLEIDLLQSNIKNTKAQHKAIYWISIGTIVSALATTIQALVDFRAIEIRNGFVVYAVYTFLFLCGLIAGIIIYMLISEGLNRRKQG